MGALLAILIVIAGVLGLPMAWLVMLALGNFGFSEFGFIDCIPAGIILSALASSASTKAGR